MRPNWQKRGRGFTLVELVAVLAIIALFGAVAIPTIMSYRSRRSRDLDNAALMLRATLRAARAYAIRSRVPAGVVFDPVLIDPDTGRYRGSRYHVRYERDDGSWEVPMGIAGKDTLLPQNLSYELVTTPPPVDVVDDALPGVVMPKPAHVFDPTGTLDNPSALKAVIEIQDNSREVPNIQIEILRPTGRVRIKG